MSQNHNIKSSELHIINPQSPCFNDFKGDRKQSLLYLLSWLQFEGVSFEFCVLCVYVFPFILSFSPRLVSLHTSCLCSFSSAVIVGPTLIHFTCSLPCGLRSACSCCDLPTLSSCFWLGFSLSALFCPCGIHLHVSNWHPGLDPCLSWTCKFD